MSGHTSHLALPSPTLPLSKFISPGPALLTGAITPEMDGGITAACALQEAYNKTRRQTQGAE